MKPLLLFLIFAPHDGFAGLKAISPAESRSAKPRQGRGATQGGKYIGTVRQVRGGKFAVQLGRGLALHKKKLQVAAASQGKKFSAGAPPASQRPAYVYFYDFHGIKRGRAKFSAARDSRTIIFELAKGQRPPAAGWRIGLEDLSLLTTDGQSFGLGLFYELKWK